MKHREFIALLGGVERIGVRLTTHAARNAKPLIRTSRSDTSSTLRPGIQDAHLHERFTAAALRRMGLQA